jgi:hypothetical protein
MPPPHLVVLFVLLHPNEMWDVWLEMPSFESDKCNVADPDPGCGMGKKSRSGSGMNIPESLETIFWVKNT